MNNVVAVIDKTHFSSYATKSWLHYDNTYTAILDKISFIKKIYTLAPDGNLPIEKNPSLYNIIKTIDKAIEDRNTHVVYIDAQAPFLDVPLLKTMIETSHTYRSQYHFADGYPKGLTAQIIHASILESLAELAQESYTDELYNKHNFFFELMRAKLNDFDIETTLSPVDLRERRIELVYDSKNNSVISQKFLDAGIIDVASLLNNLEVVDSLNIGVPAYYNFQISSNCPQICTYCPQPQLNNFNTNKNMKLDLFQKTLESIVNFSGEAVIGLSLLGEPALHPNLTEFIDAVLKNPTLKLHIETSGIGWKLKDIENLAKQASPRVSLILSLDALNEKEYKIMRGEHFKEALEFFHNILKLPDLKKRLWVQRVRLNSVEDGLQQFYYEAKKSHSQLIIQKYHNYSNMLPKQEDVDLSPLIRRGCWALQREMSIYIDGSVHLCRVDVQSKHKIGTIHEHSLEELWGRIKRFHIAHINKTYPSLCEHCEEYYIYTF